MKYDIDFINHGGEPGLDDKEIAKNLTEKQTSDLLLKLIKDKSLYEYSVTKWDDKVIDDFGYPEHLGTLNAEEWMDEQGFDTVKLREGGD